MMSLSAQIHGDEADEDQRDPRTGQRQQAHRREPGQGRVAPVEVADRRPIAP